MVSRKTEQKSDKQYDMALRQLIECFENQRYIPISGWTRPGLAGDRQSFTNRDGSAGFKTMEEFEAALLSEGWSFDEEEDWVVANDDVNCDEEGYSYCVGFEGFSEKDSPRDKAAPKSVLCSPNTRE